MNYQDCLGITRILLGFSRILWKLGWETPLQLRPATVTLSGQLQSLHWTPIEELFQNGPHERPEPDNYWALL